MNAMAIFAMQVIVSATLISFSIGMLATGRGETSVYLPLLSGVTATWLPNPSYPKPPLNPSTNSEKTVSINGINGINGINEVPTAQSVPDIEMGLVEPFKPTVRVTA